MNTFLSYKTVGVLHYEFLNMNVGFVNVYAENLFLYVMIVEKIKNVKNNFQIKMIFIKNNF